MYFYYITDLWEYVLINKCVIYLLYVYIRLVFSDLVIFFNSLDLKYVYMCIIVIIICFIVDRILFFLLLIVEYCLKSNFIFSLFKL